MQAPKRRETWAGTEVCLVSQSQHDTKSNCPLRYCVSFHESAINDMRHACKVEVEF